MREYYTEAYYARILNPNKNYQTNTNQSYGNSQRIHPPHMLRPGEEWDDACSSCDAR